MVGILKNKKAELLNSKAAREESRAGEIISALELEKGQTVADIGSGGGYFSVLLSNAVGAKGKVYMADSDSRMLDFSVEYAKEKGVENIVPVLAGSGALGLPQGAISLVFMRNVCHHLRGRKEYLAALRQFLAPWGKVALIDYRRGSFLKFRWLFGHYVEEDVIKKEMEDAGFRLEKSFDFIARQWFMVFSPLPSQESR